MGESLKQLHARDPNAINAVDESSGMQAIHGAARRPHPGAMEALRWLVSPEGGGVSVRAEANDGKQAVHMAAEIGNWRALEELGELGASLTAKGGEEAAPPALYAALQQRVSAAEYLLEHAYGGDFARMMQAARSSNTGDGMVHAAATSGSQEIMRWLLEKDEGLLENRDNAAKTTPLQHAAYHGQTEMVSMLIHSFGADVNAVETDHGATAAHFAAARGHVDVLEVLQRVGDGAALAATDKYGSHPSDVAEKLLEEWRAAKSKGRGLVMKQKYNTLSYLDGERLERFFDEL